MGSAKQRPMRVRARAEMVRNCMLVVRVVGKGWMSWLSWMKLIAGLTVLECC